MLEINWDDVINILNLCKPYLIGFGVILLLVIIAFIVVRKMPKPKRFFIRMQSLMVLLIALITVINLICWGPLSTLITLATNSGQIEEKTMAKAEKLAEDISSEGIVLLENKDSVLPLQDKDQKLNVFGWSSTNPVYGGTGSGSLSNSFHIVSLLEGLSNAGIETNEKISDFYSEYRDERPEVGLFEQDWTLPEPPVKDYEQDLMDDAKEFSDKALIVITRVGGEGADLPTEVKDVTYKNNSKDYSDYEEGQHYLELSQSERNMVEMVCQNFDDVVLVYNGANTFELGFVEEFEQIKGVIWSPGTGQTGFNSLGKILTGEVNPSAKAADTFVYDMTTSPSWNNFGEFTYSNMKDFGVKSEFTDGQPTFVNYVEGIYVGYRYYETAAAEGIIDYDKTVKYPFGHGLSYSSFEQKMGDLKVENQGKVEVDVTVTNTGDVAGKDVAELYYTPPYEDGGLEKSEVNLVAFDKTKVLEPGESETLTLSFLEEDMASFDTYNTGNWVLEDGEYKVSLRNNSHDVTREQTIDINEEVVYDKDNARTSDKNAAEKQFEFAEGKVSYLSRKNDFENLEQAKAAPASHEMDSELMKGFYNDSNYDTKDFEDPDAKMPTTGANNDLELVDLRGKSFDDKDWAPLLDKLKVEEMVNLIALGGYQTAEIKSVGKVQTVDLDGPASINNNFTGVGSIGMPSAVILASSFNEDLAKAFGDIIGQMATEMEVSGWYAPGMNLHRSAFGGRNFEYYSEDGLLSGKIAAQAVIGAADHGVYSYIKHLGLNDQETNRWRMLCTWSNEQAIREIYLKPFELSIKEGGTSAVMSAYNYIGNEWAGSSNALLNNVLRNEWGFEGMVVTDYFAGFGYMDADRMIRNGGDFSLIAYDNNGNFLDDTTSATAVSNMRRASKNILYAVVNSRAYEDGAYNSGLRNWQIGFIIGNVIILLVVVFLERMILKKYKRLSQVEEA